MTDPSPALGHVGAHEPLETLLGRLWRDGCVIIDDVIDKARLARIAGELDAWLAATPRCEGDFYGWSTTRVGGLLVKAPACRRLVTEPKILALSEAVLKPHCDAIQLNLTQAVRIHPGERAQPPHRDEEMWPGQKGRGEWLVNVLWAIDDFTEANGATRVWPGSHHHPLDRAIDSTLSAPAIMRAGSALVFLGSLTHGAGANESGADRTGVIVSYCLGWLRQYENHYLTYPPDIARTFAPELQALVGYRIHRPNLGGWEGQCPSRLLEGVTGPLPHVDALPPEAQAALAALKASGTV